MAVNHELFESRMSPGLPPGGILSYRSGGRMIGPDEFTLFQIMVKVTGKMQRMVVYIVILLRYVQFSPIMKYPLYLISSKLLSTYCT